MNALTRETINLGVGLTKQRFSTAVIKNGGVATNVVPDYATLSIQYRATNVADLEELGKRVEDCARAGALLSNTELKLSVPCPPYLPLNTNAALAEHYREHCEAEGSAIPRLSEDAG